MWNFCNDFAGFSLGFAHLDGTAWGRLLMACLIDMDGFYVRKKGVGLV